MRTAMIAAAIFLGSCASAPVISVQQSCVPMAAYTTQQQMDAATALALLDPTNPLVMFITDYAAMRAADRACLSTTKGKP